ncbi:SLBB domain-containing protein [Gammaproteobacteria bacterium]|nr:SLBB domain-containing protein [Gammaproteobacteria bacterium]
MNINKKFILVLTCLSFIGSSLFSDVTLEQEELLKKLPPDQRTAMLEKMEESNELSEDIEESFSRESFLAERPELKEGEKEINKCEECVYGYDLFRFSPSTFAPANIVPVSFSYILGPGDELTVSFYGSNEDSITGFIQRDGTFNLPLLGPVNLAGFTFTEAQEHLKKRIKEELIGTKISISLNKLRSITVYVLGEAYKPGSYTLSALSTITNTLFLSGGVNKLGSLRNIQIKREGKLVNTYDLYDLLIKGDTTTDIRLRDGDTIFIPFIENVVTLGGAFKRPHLYELLDGETLEDVISFAGGFKAEVGFNPEIELSTINRVSNKREISRVVYNENSKNKKILNGDGLNVSEISGLKPFSVELTGEFKNPGVYAISEGDTVLDVVSKAGGYTNSAFVEGGVFLREEVAKIEEEGFKRTADNLEELLFSVVQDSSTEVTEFTFLPVITVIERLRKVEPVGRVVMSLDTLELKTDPYSNFEVRHGDRIHVPKRPSSVSVVGEVLAATTIQFYPEKKVNDYIGAAGGLNSQADRDAIYIIGPNGQAELYKSKYLGKSNIEIIPGSTIVVSRDSRPWDALNIARILTPILADLAISTAAIAAVN